MLYEKLANLYEEVSNTSKRLEKIEILSKFLNHLHIQDKDVLYLLLGDIYPEYDERKIGISNNLAMKTLSKASGINPKIIIKEWKTIGDLGEVAQKLISKKKQSTLNSFSLTTTKVLQNLRKLPTLEGKGTIEKKISLITELLTSASPLQAKYIIRTLIGDLRIGILESTIRESFVKSFFKDISDSHKIIQDAIDRSNDIAQIFELSKKGNIDELKKIHIELEKPIKVMLAQKALSIDHAFKELGTPCAIEYKYDGFRTIIHKNNDKIKIYTRRLENITNQFPEIAEYIKEHINAKTAILDCESVGYNPKNKEYKPFQDISQRIKRKHNIKDLQKKLPVEVNVFDILYYNNKSLLDKPFKERSKILRQITKDHPYKIVTAKQIITSDKKEVEIFYKNALKDNQEGIMFKSLESIYQIGKRVGHMLKLKPENKDLDLVITGAEYGKGKRSGWFSSFIISCKDNENFLEIGKVGSGIKEKKEQGVSFEELTNLIKPLIISEKNKEIKIKPRIIISVTYQEIQKSPSYSSGFALRFPRLKTIRNDKTLKEINSLDEIKKDFENQKRNWKYG